MYSFTPPDHVPATATFTILNFVVDDVDRTVTNSLN